MSEAEKKVMEEETGKSTFDQPEDAGRAEDPADPEASAGEEAAPEAGDADAKKAEEPEEVKAEAPKEEPEKESERYMRLMAEFQNYKKRVAKEKSDIRTYANEEIVTELLSVLDNFERALASDPLGDPEAYAKGMELIFTQMKTVLEKAGLLEIEALGADFDPAEHNAVMTEDSEEYGSGKVSKVLQKGYTLNKKVIRPAMVAVTN